MRGSRKAAGLLKLLIRSPPLPAASHRLAAFGRARIDHCGDPTTTPLDSEGRTGTFKIRVALRRNRDLGQPKGSERDGDAVPARFY
eukprot:2533992-Prymnesium_polylepis.1